MFKSAALRFFPDDADIKFCIIALEVSNCCFVNANSSAAVGVAGAGVAEVGFVPPGVTLAAVAAAPGAGGATGAPVGDPVVEFLPDIVQGEYRVMQTKQNKEKLVVAAKKSKGQFNKVLTRYVD